VTLGGFKPVVREVEVRTNAQTQLDLVLLATDAVEAASRIAESIEDAPASVTLVPTPELRGMRYPTVAEALRGVRGVYVSDDRQYKSVGFRGFSRPGDYGNRVLVLIDGQPVNDNWLWSSYVGYDLRTDLDDIARIEVVRGPGSVLYGTGAFSGVINLVTLGADAPDGREVGVSVADEGVARARARITHHFAKNIGVWTSVSAGRSAGNDYFFPEWVNDSAPTIAGHARGVDDFRVATAQGRFFYDVASVQWFFNTHDKAIPIGDSGVLFGDARNRQRDTRAYVEAKVEPKLGKMLTSTTRVHANYYGFRSALPTDPGNGGLDRNAYDGSWVGAEQRIVLTPVDALRLTGGGEVQYHFLAHELTRSELQGVSFDQDKRFTLAAGYAMADLLPVRTIKISAAARVDAYSTSGASINPRLAVVVKPYEGGNVKLLVGKAFRAPSIYELTSSGGGLVANPELRSENLYSSEIEYSHRFSQSVVGTLTAYANVITDLIALRDLPPLPGAVEAPYRYENTRVPVGTLGGEAEVRREWKGGWMLGASYSFQRSRYLASESLTSLFSGKTAEGLREVPNSPNHGGSVRGAAPILGRALLLTSRLTAEAPRWDRNDVDGSPPQGRTQPALLWDVVLSGSEARWGLSYALGLYNAFDTRWTVPLSTEFRQTKIVQNGRTVLASAGLTF
jgi:outer membrane receptor protein involved in Fe transport